MNVAPIVKFLEVLASIAFLVWFFYGPRRQLVLDLARQNLFELRDEVFDLAAKGRIEFSHPAYLAFRNRINAMIRFCENYSPLALVVAPRSSTPPAIFHILRSIEDPKVSRELEHKYKVAITILLISLLFRSVIQTVVLLPLVTIFLFRAMIRGVKDFDGLATGFEERLERDLDREELAPYVL